MEEVAELELCQRQTSRGIQPGAIPRKIAVLRRRAFDVPLVTFDLDIAPST